jgi:hypothetical protein
LAVFDERCGGYRQSERGVERREGEEEEMERDVRLLSDEDDEDDDEEIFYD